MKILFQSLLFFAVFTLVSGCAHHSSHHSKYRDPVKAFVTLPEGVAFPEGIAINPESRDVYVATFSFAGNNALLRYSNEGELLARVSFDKTPLLGLAYNPVDKKVYVCNAGDLVGDKSRIQRIVSDFDSSSAVEEVVTVPHIGAPGSRTVGNPDGSNDVVKFGNNAAAPNAMAFDTEGNLYVSDSFQGAVFVLKNVATSSSVDAETVVHDPLLATAGFPPFGANGLAIDGDKNVLFVANTGDDRILKLDLSSRKITVFSESINGADGLAMDAGGNLWVAANQADAVKMVDENGQVIKTINGFYGISEEGAPRGLCFPASIAVEGGFLYVTNLSLPLTPASGDEPEEDVTLYTISKIKI